MAFHQKNAAPMVADEVELVAFVANRSGNRLNGQGQSKAARIGNRRTGSAQNRRASQSIERRFLATLSHELRTPLMPFGLVANASESQSRRKAKRKKRSLQSNATRGRKIN
jgi:signal transduction histidine kinase